MNLIDKLPIVEKARRLRKTAAHKGINPIVSGKNGMTFTHEPKAKVQAAHPHLAVVCFLLCLLLAACDQHTIPEERASRASEAPADAPIQIGVGWPLQSLPRFNWGINMAVEEINAAGGVLGRPLLTIKQDDRSDVTQGRLIAQQFADNLDLVAVIGHSDSFVSLPASATYQFAGLLMLSPGSTNPALTMQGFDLVFRNVPTDDDIGRQLATYALTAGYRRMLILYQNDTYGRELGNVFERYAARFGIEIVDRRSYVEGQGTFAPILKLWKKLPFDAIFVAGNAPEAAIFIREARAADITQPILGGNGLDSPELLSAGGAAVEGVVVASFFHPDLPTARDFTARFQATYGVLPDAAAAQGYDAVHLLAYAIEQAGSVVPAEIAAALHTVSRWSGVTGTHTFNERGDVVNKPIVLKVVQNGDFQFLQLVGGGD